ncbi:hypothetical protein Q5P01_021318 [Channa striata]|uniref:Translin-associated factor X-interacting protein 1 N-terminal domain-containing protein n=1 Tax=Channa striata TaxID=64152 RepID=A0AA88LVG2_CHASR|nr:hypothetical protein Q5P01_021318 [Channa striata]
MSSSCKPNPLCFGSDIHRLLLAAEAGQKTDILTYYSGHLGPRSLKQNLPQSDTKQDIWKLPPSQKENPSLLTQRQKRTQTYVKKRDGKESLCEFTAVTALVECEVSGSRQEQTTDHASYADRREDLSLPKIAPSSSDSVLLQPRAFSHKRYNCPSNSKQKKQVCPVRPDQEGLKNDNQLKTKQQFGRKFIGKQDSWTEKNVAEIHERKLQKELKKLSAQSWPCRDRLAVFSDVFDDVCESSPVFGRILREIKTDYDLYVNHMMDSQSPVHNVSLNITPDDPGYSKVSEMELEDAKNEVCRLEQEARTVLEEKQRIQNELQNVTAITGPEDSDMNRLQDSGTGNTSCVQSKRLQVLNMWREIQQLEEEIKEKLVSTVTTTATESCIKVLQTEIMRLIASNDRLKTVNKDLENKINMMLSREKSSKTLRRLLWDEI